jgi:hypothetical protein
MSMRRTGEIEVERKEHVFEFRAIQHVVQADAKVVARLIDQFEDCLLRQAVCNGVGLVRLLSRGFILSLNQTQRNLNGKVQQNAK